jgi:hypothetical protein
VAGRRLRGLASSALLVAMLAVLVVLDWLNLVPLAYRIAPRSYGLASHDITALPPTGLVVFGLIAIAGFAAALAPPQRRRAILAIAGVLALIVGLRGWAFAMFGYSAFVMVVARLRLPIVVRFAFALAAWLVVPVLRVEVFAGELQAATILLAQLWIGMLVAALYLIVERTRALPGESTTVVDDIFYLMAPPRLVMPFFQPISSRELVLVERANYPRRLIARGAALAVYAIIVALAAQQLEQIPAPEAARLPLKFIAHYAHAANAILLAMAAFRLLGYDVAAGFRYPFLSRTFADFFRRYNHYVRDAVVSLFFLPFLGHLRHRMSRRAASITSAFLAIAFGSLALQDLLIPAGISLRPMATVHALLRPHRFAAMLTMWMLIVVPNAGIAPRRLRPAPKWRVALQIILVDAIYIGLWYLQVR